MRLTLRALRTILSEAISPSATSQEIAITAPDFFSFAKLAPSGKEYRTAASVGETISADPNDGPVRDVVKRVVELNRSGYEITPSDIVGALKRPREVFNRQTGDSITFSVSERDRSVIIAKLASVLINDPTIKSRKIVAVTPVDSSSDVPERLANVISTAVGAPVVNLIYKLKPREFHFNEELFNSEKAGSTPTAREKLKKVLINQDASLNAMLARGETPKSSDFKESTRRFYNLLELDNDEWITRRNGHVIVVDDNVREGVTFRQIKNDLEKLGFPRNNVHFVAGYRLPQ